MAGLLFSTIEIMSKIRPHYNKTMIERMIMLAAMDVISVLLASVLAIYVRYDFVFGDIPRRYINATMQIAAISVVITPVVFWFFKLYKSVWRYASATEMVSILGAVASVSVIQFIIIQLLGINLDGKSFLPRSYSPFFMIALAIFTIGIRFSYRAFRIVKTKRKQLTSGVKTSNVMVIGAGAAGNEIIKEITQTQYLTMKVCCIIDDGKNCWGKRLRGIPIIGGREMIDSAVKEYDIDEIIIAIPSASKTVIKELTEICKETGCKLRILPGIYQLINGDVSVAQLRDVQIEDLLGREPVTIKLDEIMGYVSGKVVMVTGGGGSIGSELCRQIAEHEPKTLVIVDIYENNAYDIQQELKRKYPELDLVVLIASVRNTKRMDKIFEKYRPELVYHAAAHKHVPLMEDSPNEAIKNNVLGTLKVVRAADKWGVKRFVLISTDKAVNPTNIMGASKRICEMIVQTYNNRSKTEYVAVRFGNVLGSNGSVIPLFRKQIAEGGPVTVTDENIIRYFMTIPEAVSLVLQAGAYAKGGEIFVLDMGEPVRIMDLAENLIKLSGYRVGEDIEIKITGLRPGEKMYEEMLMKEEGLKDTPNKLIHIGKPIEMNEEKFLKDLEEIGKYVVEEPEDIREWVEKIVPTYVPADNK